ncbi:hypothetical protein AKJ54_00240 [candidate division MSBL1 archaeon SCGC-AAA382K21]|uniref:Uncharacterized protein n=1 Tax=candidate division MSBL1 archaeon SCGC-AAA382K21 TaxID=1698283 RepID=A0A133VLY3_9EURY|nr:hypothetical protein AKJ54_00240 [candidate division MSBL1 archaeon SCGC-AAA382K21]
MELKEFWSDEFSMTEEEEAEIVAFLTGKIPFFDKESGKYRTLAHEEFRTRVKELYEEDRYDDAETLIEAFNRYSSSSPEKRIREIKSKSFRLSKVQFFKALKQGYEDDASVADVIRANIGDKLKAGLENLNQIPNIDGEKLRLPKEILENWLSREGRGPLKFGYNLKWEIYVSDEDRKSYERFLRHFTRKNILETQIEDQRIIDIFLKFYESDPNALFEGVSLETLENDNGELALKFRQHPAFYFEPLMHGGYHKNLKTLDDFLSELANEGYEVGDLEELPIFNQIPKFASRVESIKNGGYEQLAWARDIGIEHNIGFDIANEIHPLLRFSRPVRINGESLIWGDTPLEQDHLKESILSEILEDEVRHLDIDESKKKVETFLEEGNAEKAQKISRRISAFKSAEAVAEKTEEIILDGISSQVVSLTMPKGVAGLLNLFNLKKEDMAGG